MSDYEQAVFISYAWGGEREDIVNQIDQALQKRGIKIIRDKRDLGYKGSISEFMELIGRGNCVIVVISDKYLRSPNCMFELVEIAEGKQFHDRIFPVVLNDANIYDPIKRLDYVKHWEAKRAELAQAMREVDPANLQGIRDDMDLYDRIRDEVSGLTSTLKDMNTLTPDMHRDADFSQMYDAIMKRLQSAGTESNETSPETNSSGKPATKEERKSMSKDENPKPVSQTFNFGGDQNNMSGNVSAGGIAFVGGHNAKITINQSQGIDAKELAGLFETLYQRIEARPADPNIDKDEIVETVKKIEEESSKGEEANQSKLGRWMETLNKMAPDIVDVALASLGGPVSGVTAVLKKIADHAKQA